MFHACTPRLILAVLALSLPTVAARPVNAQVPLPEASAASQNDAADLSNDRPQLYLQVGHQGTINKILYSPDGRLLATASDDKTIKIWNADDGTLLHTLVGHHGVVESIAFSPSGRLLASKGDDSTLRIWNVRTGQLIHTFLDRSSTPLPARERERLKAKFGDMVNMFFLTGLTSNDVALQDENTVQCGDGDWISRRSIETGTRLTSIFLGASKTRTFTDFEVGLSANGKFAVLEQLDGGFSIVDTATGKTLKSFPGDGRLFSHAEISSDGRMVCIQKLSLGLDRRGNPSTGSLETVAINVRTGKQLPLVGQFESAVAFSSDGRMIVATDRATGTLQIWKMDGRRPHLQNTIAMATFVMERHRLRMSATNICLSSDGTKVAAALSDRTVRIWNVATGRSLMSTQENPAWGQVFSGFWGYGLRPHTPHPAGRVLAIGTDARVRTWDMSTGNLTTSISRSQMNIAQSLNVLADPHVTQEQASEATDAVYAAYCTILLSGRGAFADAFIYGQEAGKNLTILNGAKTIASFPRPLQSAGDDVNIQYAISPDARLTAYSAYVSSQSEVAFWDIRTQQCLFKLKNVCKVTSMTFSPDSSLIALMDGTAHEVVIVDTLRQMVIRRIQVTGFTQEWLQVAFSPDDKLLATFGFGTDGSNSRLNVWDAQTGEGLWQAQEHTGDISDITFSGDGSRIVTAGKDGTLGIWSVPQRRLLVRLIALPGAKADVEQLIPAQVAAKDVPSNNEDWFTTTPEGYFDCSANAVRYIRWMVNGRTYPAERYYRRFRRPDLVQKALRGERIDAPVMTNDDIPPAAQFATVQVSGNPGQQTATIAFDVFGRHEIKDVQLLVNGRPLPPDDAQPLAVTPLAQALTAPAPDLGKKGRVIDVEGRGDLIDVSGRGEVIDVSGRPGPGADTPAQIGYTVAQRYVYHVPLPLGVNETRLRAVAYDAADLGSDPTEITLAQKSVPPVPGSLYVLCVGIGNYRNGVPSGTVSSDTKGPVKGSLPDLRFPAQDAAALAQRFAQEGKPLYQSVQVHTLTDGQATLDGLRRELRWLQTSVRPGQVDTAIICLSGHGFSDSQGHFSFPSYDFDSALPTSTSLSGAELQQALGGQLRAKDVFLFVDSCHSGALASRTDDLSFDLNDSGVYLLASSGASQTSYESSAWGHGAFSKALLDSLSDRTLAPDGMLRFNVLTYAVPNRIAQLMQGVSLTTDNEQPVVPLDGRSLLVPVVQVPAGAR